jgi:hypothetical protein
MHDLNGGIAVTLIDVNHITPLLTTTPRYPRPLQPYPVQLLYTLKMPVLDLQNHTCQTNESENPKAGKRSSKKNHPRAAGKENKVKPMRKK